MKIFRCDAGTMASMRPRSDDRGNLDKITALCVADIGFNEAAIR